MGHAGDFDPAWFGYGALIALLAASLAARIDLTRIGIGLAALLALPLAIFGWQNVYCSLVIGAILVVNLAIGARLFMRRGRIRFSKEEEALRSRHFETLSPADARSLIDQGHWIDARSGEVLIRESQAAPSLFYLASGTATILRDGTEVGTLGDGDLIGEATVIDGSHATGTAVLSTAARLWFVPAEVLCAYLAVHSDIAGALHEGFARALRGKLANANARIADMRPL